MTPVSNGNGRSWQLAFWVISTLCGIWLLALTNGVVANDRIREGGDKALSMRIESTKDVVYEKLVLIDRRLSRIEALLETRTTL